MRWIGLTPYSATQVSTAAANAMTSSTTATRFGQCGRSKPGGRRVTARPGEQQRERADADQERDVERFGPESRTGDIHRPRAEHGADRGTSRQRGERPSSRPMPPSVSAAVTMNAANFGSRQPASAMNWDVVEKSMALISPA